MEKFKNSETLKSVSETAPTQDSSVESVEHIRAIEKVKQSLDGIDQDVLKDCIVSVLEPAGVPDNIDRYIDVSEVKIISVADGSAKETAYFNPRIKGGTPEITINAARVAEKTQTEDDIFQLTMYAFIHEQTHSLSFDRRKITDYDNDSDKWHIGFEQQEKKRGSDILVREHVKVNEAMTDMIAEEITQEYLARTGRVSGKNRETFFNIRTEDVYHEYKKDLKRTITELGEEYSVPEELIWQGLVVFYFKGNKLYDNFPDWLNENHPEMTDDGRIRDMFSHWR